MKGLAALLLVAAGCGGGASPPAGPPQPGEGRVMLENQTGYAVEVAFLDAREQIVRTQVAPGQVAEVSGGVLPGGTEWTFDLVLLLPEEQGYRVRRKARVRIEGEVRLRASLPDPEDPFSLQFGRAEI
ncbi:MAG: hypothetical protein HYW07_23250 [Candidatus Latescibacteria bacterium]|nr:hypothetical protein [Candidatus Latescibacterota bacterium]